MYPYFKSHRDSSQSPQPSKELVSWFFFFEDSKIPCVLIRVKANGKIKDSYGQHQLWREGTEHTQGQVPNNEPLPDGERVMSYKWAH